MMFRRIESKRTDENGFSLAELLVGMMVGAVIFTLAIAFLVSFSTTSIRANARSEIANNARIGLTKSLKELSGAAPMPGCGQWKNVASVPALGVRPTIDQLKNKCTDLINTSEVLRQAEDNSVCWNKSKEVSSNTAVIFPDKYGCLYRGDGRPLCGAAGSADIIYYAECNINSTVPISGTSKIIADLGPHKATGAPGNLPDRVNLFKYVTYDSSAFTVGYTATDKVLKVTLNANISYENGSSNSLGKEYSIYKFSSTIQLSGMRAFLETGAYGS